MNKQPSQEAIEYTNKCLSGTGVSEGVWLQTAAAFQQAIDAAYVEGARCERTLMERGQKGKK